MGKDNLMNILKELVTKVRNPVTIKTILGEERYCFYWNEPASLEEIEDFENRNKCRIPVDYKEFLLSSNGAIIYKSESEYEDDGYKLLGMKEMEILTHEMRDDGYDIPDNWYCFIQCMFCDDILLLDLNKEENYIVDGDVGYPPDEWSYINLDINTFFARLFQCNGAVYWRW